MKKINIPLIFLAFMCMSCVATVGPHGTSVVVVPPLPLVVELGDPYYFHGGYHYYYHSDRWYYSKSQGGPWIDLPRDHYPREVRFRGKGDERNSPDRDRGEKRDWKQNKDRKDDRDRGDERDRGKKRGQDRD